MKFLLYLFLCSLLINSLISGLVDMQILRMWLFPEYADYVKIKNPHHFVAYKLKSMRFGTICSRILQASARVYFLTSPIAVYMWLQNYTEMPLDLTVILGAGFLISAVSNVITYRNTIRPMIKSTMLVEDKNIETHQSHA